MSLAGAGPCPSMATPYTQTPNPQIVRYASNAHAQRIHALPSGAPVVAAPSAATATVQVPPRTLLRSAPQRRQDSAQPTSKKGVHKLLMITRVESALRCRLGKSSTWLRCGRRPPSDETANGRAVHRQWRPRISHLAGVDAHQLLTLCKNWPTAGSLLIIGEAGR